MAYHRQTCEPGCVFARQSLATSRSVHALNTVDEWGPSGHWRIAIELADDARRRCHPRLRRARRAPVLVRGPVPVPVDRLNAEERRRHKAPPNFFCLSEPWTDETPPVVCCESAGGRATWGGRASLEVGWLKNSAASLPPRSQITPDKRHDRERLRPVTVRGAWHRSGQALGVTEEVWKRQAQAPASRSSSTALRSTPQR